MSDFNPYRDWLDLDLTDKPTYYQLLGVSPSETDVEEIRHQAKRRLRKLEKIDDVSRETLKQRLVTQIKRAAKVLLSEELRKKYDEKLATAAPVVKTGTPKVRSAVRIDPKAKKKASVSQRYKQQAKQRGMMWLCGLLGFVSIVGICYLVVTQTSFGKSLLGPGESSPSKSKEVAKKPDIVRPPVVVNSNDNNNENERPEPLDVEVSTERESNTPAEQSGSNEMPVMEESRPSRPTPSAEQLQQFGKVLSDARRALEDQDSAQAKRLLATAKSMPAREKDREKYERLVTLTSYVADYWKATDDALNRLNGGDELMIGERRIILVEVTADRLVIRAEGQNRTFTRDSLPMWFRVWLADSWFDANAASTKVFRGAMMAVNSEYGADQARKTWQEAQREGADLNDLQLVLDDDYDLTK